MEAMVPLGCSLKIQHIVHLIPNLYTLVQRRVERDTGVKFVEVDLPWGCSGISETCIYSVFPWHCFSFKSARVISLFGVQLDLSISPMLKLLYLTSLSEVFTLYYSLFSLKYK